MIEYSVTAWLLFFAFVGMSIMAGLGVARQAKWSVSALQAKMDIAFAFAMAPFLLGGATVLILSLFPGDSHFTHLVCVALLLLLAASLNLTARRGTDFHVESGETDRVLFYLLCGLLLFWFFLLIANSVLLPLTPNDALEYATVGRILFEARSLEAYPAINPDATASGFYGPWTHPPLYVSLIYLVSAIQGHADAPGLMRLISPWFLCSAVYGVISIGALRGKNFGLVAGVICISTPLLFFGADMASIDSLTVCGLVLVLIYFLGSGQSHFAFGFWLGIAIGLSLWAHSQSVLLIPIFAAAIGIYRGLVRWRQALGELSIALLVAAIVAGEPYYANYLIYGSPISDTPTVFALETLDWEGYFSFARGLDTTFALIQYGLLKGWFVLHAYGYLFWLTAAGIITVFLVRFKQDHARLILDGIGQCLPENRVIWLSSFLMIVYFLGVVVSLIMGIDLLVRNDRYLLLTVPVASICSAYFVLEAGSKIFARWKAKKGGPIYKIFVLSSVAFVVFIMVMQMLVMGWHYRWKEITSAPNILPDHNSAQTDQFQSHTRLERILRLRSHFRTVLDMDGWIATDALIFSMRPADMYYSNRKMISYLDPRLEQVYAQRDPDAMAVKLAELGVSYLHLNDYFLPPFYNTALIELVSDPSLSTLVYDDALTQVYKFGDSRLRPGISREFSPDIMPWTAMPALRVVGKKPLQMLGIEPHRVPRDGSSVSSFPLFHRDYSVVLASGNGIGPAWHGSENAIRVKPDTEYLVAFELSGRSLIRIGLSEFDTEGNYSSTDYSGAAGPARFGDMVLSGKYPQRKFMRRFKTAPNSRYARLFLQHVGQSHVTISEAFIIELTQE